MKLNNPIKNCPNCKDTGDISFGCSSKQCPWYIGDQNSKNCFHLLDDRKFSLGDISIYLNIPVAEVKALLASSIIKMQEYAEVFDLNEEIFQEDIPVVTQHRIFYQDNSVGKISCLYWNHGIKNQRKNILKS